MWNRLSAIVVEATTFNMTAVQIPMVMVFALIGLVMNVVRKEWTVIPQHLHHSILTKNGLLASDDKQSF